MLTYGSVCSGIEAASVAWEPLGFKPKWFSEIEPFPSAVLNHHWPSVINLGDMTKIASHIQSGEVEAPEVLVGGTPCQAFSVAGARKGLADERGQLTISYGELADAIDDTRIAAGKHPAIIVWENVPGALSSKDNAFGAFLGLLSGEECELVPSGSKWTNAGYVHGPKRSIAWRVLDAQYFGVAQRRRRVFVVASARKDFDPTAVLFEREGVRRDTAPSRETGSVVAALTANRVGTCGADDNQGQAGHLIAVHGTQDPDTNTELAHMLGRNHGQENAVLISGQESLTPWEQQGRRIQGENGVAPTLMCNPKGGMKLEPVLSDLAVRRLMPVECERLQGFPDGHTAIPYRNKPAADGHRYKALGNSMAVPVITWLGKRIIKELTKINNK